MNRQDSRARAEQAFRLRAVGRSWQEIANALGYRSRGAAQLAAKRLLDRNAPESNEAARRSASEGLRITMATLFTTLSDARERRDDQTVISAARAIGDTVDKITRLNGLLVPVAQQVDVTVTQTPAAIIDRMESDLLALAAQHQQQHRQHQLPGNVIDAEVIEPKEVAR
jgi:hypothetical protein